MKPQISVIMGVRNQAAYLPTAISSILNQSFSNLEFIIINDASTNTTAAVLNRFKDKRIKLFTNSTHQGLARSLNRGIRHSRGDYIARMDADDIAYPQRLETQLNYLIKHPGVAACGTAANLINTHGQKIGIKRFPARITPSLLMRFNPLIHPTVMIRKKFVTYDPGLNGAEDYDLWLRLCSQYQLANINKILLAYRVNPEGISWNDLKHTELQAIKARFKALMQYNYPLWQAIFIIKPVLSYFIPSWVKKLLFNIS